MIYQHNASSLLSIKEAAEILNVNTEYFIKLLTRNEIPHILINNEVKVFVIPLLLYKKNVGKQRNKLMQELIDLTEEAGLYNLKFLV